MLLIHQNHACDLTPFHCFVLGCVKVQVYKNNPQLCSELKDKVISIIEVNQNCQVYSDLHDLNKKLFKLSTCKSKQICDKMNYLLFIIILFFIMFNIYSASLCVYSYQHASSFLYLLNSLYKYLIKYAEMLLLIL